MVRRNIEKGVSSLSWESVVKAMRNLDCGFPFGMTCPWRTLLRDRGGGLVGEMVGYWRRGSLGRRRMGVILFLSLFAVSAFVSDSMRSIFHTQKGRKRERGPAVQGEVLVEQEVQLFGGLRAVSEGV